MAVNDVSLDERLVSLVAGSLRAAADISGAVINDCIVVPEQRKDDADRFLNEYNSRVSLPSFPSSDFRSLYSKVRGLLEPRSNAVHYLNMWFWGCLAASLFNGSLPVSVVSGAAIVGAQFYSDRLKKKKSLVSIEMRSVLSASDEVYLLAFKKLREDQVGVAYDSG